MSAPREGCLAQASPRLRQALGQLASNVHLNTGEVLFNESDDDEALYFVVSGALEISALSADGRKLVLDVMCTGDLLGEIALFDPGVRTVSVAALEETQLRRIANANLLVRLRTEPNIGEDML